MALQMRSLTGALAAAAVAATSMIASAPAAQAAFSDCPTGAFCLWQDASYNGLIWNRSGTTGWLNFATAINDQATSGANRRGTLDSAANNDANGGGASFCFNGNTQTTNVGISWNDRFSSARNYDSSSVC